VQRAAAVPEKDIATRQTNTFNSSVFAGAKNDQIKERNHNTFNSTVFADPTVNKAVYGVYGRTKLGGFSKGTEVLFG